eukprot:TRINITY_DN24235_c0_g1_i1.p4 TRINITY_DN24235_c0_g1~~TRINITY_DN24235_c0_g1_i1.p4  ORF type:complete len:163 (-),score=22.69 TRINITY_DN24235_c0_g1_i1:143-631(-)
MNTLPPSCFPQSLLSHDLYIYFGHGAGSTYLPETLTQTSKLCETQKLNQETPPKTTLFLFGCSSLKQFFDKQSSQQNHVREKQGIPLALMMAKEKLVVGALWDVTDRDVDRMLGRIVEGFGRTKREIEIPELLVNAASACRFSNLNGGAFVCYGLPVKFSQL